MSLRKLSIKDKKYVDRFLALRPHRLSSYAFENIYIWKNLFDIYLAEIKDNLCVFFESKAGLFLYLPPMGEMRDAAVADRAFRIMDNRNKHRSVSRIENAEEEDIPFYKDIGYECVYKSCDYICKRADLAGLRGDRFKTKRKSANYFVKHYRFQYLPFSPEYKNGCLTLYDLWEKNRKREYSDSIYQAMLEDNRAALETMLGACRSLDCAGRIVKLDGGIKGFTFGFKLNDDVFCVLYEITDLAVKGLAQFIFREFCRELKYRFINMMDDSGLENLRRVKLSYRPESCPSYIIRRKGAF